MKATLVGTLLSIVTLIGCNPAQNAFYWGDYSESLYAFKKNPDQKTLEAHKKSLLEIITESPKKKMKIPPGICAEYGYLLLKDGKEKEGLDYLGQEQTLYPESKTFVQRVKDEYLRGKQ